ncbi:acetoin utilization deacetylase AcuC-like enzyme [Chromohalobacter marismortui]|uniref:Acetoin utilization deacetylase AcuC-like enzyme n=1 Tax=Chromohalobacter marismortui TaxID=42055 RepID=A0A4R7NPB0_9GAMM|nr:MULTISPECIES: histone deacetylase family protein [Chromohalobacter]MCI0508911.1 histone deacetylase family protein [Chromohalobacter sp.]MCI0594232.1 histone deacetylase family protein [Chromohalobacter sp.]TDU22714.1 acetoin utilization deacetylase AcuC-like enzyme [Chromohalobacter marismortui]
MITAYITHPDCMRHFMGPSHPESPKRLEAIRARLALSGVLTHTMQSEAQPVTAQTLARVHCPQYLEMLATRSPQQGLSELDAETHMNQDTLAAAGVAAGAVVRGVDQVFRHQADNVFCAVRPPGHHAERCSAMGFCFYNNVAIGVAHARQRYDVERIAVLDFDVHQGNGTIDIFKDDPGVLVCSSFQSPFYPWRYQDDTWDNIINTPLSAGAGGHEFRHRVENQWLPALQAFKPQLIMLSAGFDAHRDDPMASLNLVEADYYWVTQLALDIARIYAEGRLVSVLEGGYHLDALGSSVEAHLKALLGFPLGDP